MLAQLRPQLAHPYHNIRCRLAAALTNIFAFDLEFEGYGNANKSSPHEEEFVREVLPLLAPLVEDGAGERREAALRLLEVARRALHVGIEECGPGKPFSAIGKMRSIFYI